MRRFSNNEFQGIILQRKLESLMQEIQTLSHVTYSEESQKGPIANCLKKKDELFNDLSNLANSNTKDSPDYLEVMGDYFFFKNRLNTALINYDRAVDLNPKSFPLLIKAYNTFVAFYKLNLNRASEINTQSQEVRTALEGAAKRAQKISEHPDSTKRYTIEHLFYQALIAQSLSQYQKEIDLWEKITNLDPQNIYALRSRLKALLKRNELTASLREFNKLIRQNVDTPQDWEAVLGFLVNNNFHQEFFSWYKKAPSEFKEKHPALKIFQIRSLIELGRVAEAKELLQSINFKIKEPLAKVDKQNKSRIAETDADEFKKQGRLSEALDYYKKALLFSPNPLTVKEKISLLIYEYRKSLNFKPLEATQKDLQEVTELLYKSAFETELKSNLFEIYINSLHLTQNSKTLKKACPRFIQLYPEQKNQSFYKDNCLK